MQFETGEFIDKYELTNNQTLFESPPIEWIRMFPLKTFYFNSNHYNLNTTQLRQSIWACLELTAIGDGARLAGLARIGAVRLQLLDDVLSLDDLAEDTVLSVQPRSLDWNIEELESIQLKGLTGGDEELRAIGVRSRIRHAQQEGNGVLLLEVLIREFLSVDLNQWLD